MIDKYKNRQEAGRILAQELLTYANRDDVFVLALPRGGVPVAFEIAKALRAPLDVFIVRKLGVPDHSELAFGAIAMGGTQIFNDDIIFDLQISDESIQAVIAKEQKELKRREMAYRGNHTFPSIKDKTIILVDDGIATGASMRAAVNALLQLKPATIVIAVPVAEKTVSEKIRPLVNHFICPLLPSRLYAVGGWYEDFLQTEDEEVYALLHEARTFSLTK